MKINAQARLAKLEQAFEKLEERGVRSVKPSEIDNKGLRHVARAVVVSTGCGASPAKARMSDMRRVLGSMASQIKRVDKDHDGKLNEAECRALSKLARDLLEIAVHAKPSRPVRTGC